MISSSFQVFTKDLLKLQEAVKIVNARFKRVHVSGENTYIALEFENNEIYKNFNKVWIDFTKKITEIDKRPNFLKKFYRRHIKFWK